MSFDQQAPSARGRKPAALRNLRPRVALATALGAVTLVAVPAIGAAAVLVGGQGPDVLTGHDPNGDLIIGGGGADTLTGGPGNDRIYGVRSGDTIDGGGGNNYIEGATGADHIKAGDGNNTIISGTGPDQITAGNGNNWVDPGGAPDTIHLGDGNNVVNGASGGLDLTIGNGNNTVYLLSGPDYARLGSGVNHVYAATTGFKLVDCGGNPASTLSINALADPTGFRVKAAQSSGRIKNCPNVDTFTGPPAIISKQAPKWGTFHLTGGPGPDKLYGGHGGGTIDGGEGNNVLWADQAVDDGGAAARSKTTRITAGDGDNQVFNGTGTNFVTLGNGHNFIRGGALNNTITVGNGFNAIRLQGTGHNTITIGGGSAFVEAYGTTTVKTKITCNNGAQGTIIYGSVKPKTNCPVVVKATSKQGKLLQISGLISIPLSDPVVSDPINPGQDGHGVPRPPLTPSGT